MNYEYLVSLCHHAIYVYGATLPQNKIKPFLQYLPPPKVAYRFTSLPLIVVVQ